MHQEFIKRMYRVFSSVEKPLIEEMTPHRCPECDNVRDRLHAYNQREVPDELLIKHGDALPLLSPKALRYYFPRYIEFGLLNQDSNTFDNCLYHLAPNEIDDYWHERIAIFNAEEKSVLREYLQLRRTLEYAEYEEDHISKGLSVWT